MEITETLLSPPQVSTYLQIPVTTLYQWRHRGRGPAATRVGRHLRYRKDDVDAWVEAQGDQSAETNQRRHAPWKPSSHLLPITVNRPGRVLVAGDIMSSAP